MKTEKLETIGSQLQKRIQGDVLVDVFNRIAFSTDASIYQIMPTCVVAPRNTQDIVETVKFAAEHGLTIVPRGAGSGVAGESLGNGIVLDVTRYMNHVIGIERDGEVVICEPGVVLDEVNRFLAPMGRKIGPDPSSGNRAVMGGVVGNNATGAHSLQYGYIAEHVERIEAVTYDGTVVEFVNDYAPGSDQTGELAEIARGCMSILEGKEELIHRAQPRTKRNRCGYTIADICHDGRIDLASLLTGSEGTLAVFTKLAIRTVEVPHAQALMQLNFKTLEDLARAVPIIVDSGAAACEMMDRALMDMALETLPQYQDLFPVEGVATLLVEHAGDTLNEVSEKLNETERRVSSLTSGCQKFYDPDQQRRLWKSRKDAVPLLHREKGARHPLPFIEDVSVDNSQLDKYIRGLQEIGNRHDIPMAFYGHAGDGELHIRPYLDLHDPGDVKRMVAIANDVFELAWSLGGTISGEHADGLLRAAFIRRQYGEEYYELLHAIKDVFDPAGRLNPGKIVTDDPDVMTRHLRAQQPIVSERVETNLLFKPDEFQFEIEQCNGDGVCLSCQPGSRMCPVFRALGDELACSRAKANLLRAWITGLIDKEQFESDSFREIIDKCINCKMCSIECPSGVDISKLVMEARAELVSRKGLGRTETALSKNKFLGRLGTLFSPISNWVANLTPSRWTIEKLLGLDKRRRLPMFERGRFIRKAQRYLEEAPSIDTPIDKVAYFVDSYANFNDHELGWAVIHTLRANRIEVIVPDQLPAPLPALVYGDLQTARKDLAFSVKNLAAAVRDGYKIVCSEPSAALCLRDELHLVLDSEDARKVSENTYELMAYLNDLSKQDKLLKVQATEQRSFAYHSPCHLCALGASGASIELLGQKIGAQITDVNAGCCGLAGTCGMKRNKYDLSVKIGKSMADAINRMDTPWVMTECGACKMQIEHLTGKKVLHPIKVLAQACGVL